MLSRQNIALIEFVDTAMSSNFDTPQDNQILLLTLKDLFSPYTCSYFDIKCSN